MNVGPQSRYFNKSPETAPKDWFRISNKVDDDTTEVYILDEIGGWWGVSASEFVSQLKKIKTSKIKLHINSPGGEVFDGVAIYNALRDHDATVTVIVDALAASAASFIAQAGDKVIMNRGSTMMIHDGLAFCVGNEADMLKTAGILDTISNNIADIYADRAGGTLQEWRDLMREEVWYSAQEAVDAGLADELAVTTAPAEAVEATNRWNLSIFNHAGRGDAPSPDEIRKKVITNRAKEAPVAKSATPLAEATETTPAEGEPPATTTPAAPTVPAPEPGTTEEGGEVTTPPATTEPAPSNKSTGNSTGPKVSFLVNKVAVTDPQAVQAHIDSLETFANETRDEGRKSFCASLVKDNKALASALGGLEAFALGLSNEQFAAWQKTFDTVQSIPLLGAHADGVTNPTGDESTVAAAAADRISVLVDTVKMHKSGGMSSEKIMLTASYLELIQLQPDFKL